MWGGRLAGGTDAEDLQDVVVDREGGMARQVADQGIDRAGRKGHGRAAVRAKQVMSVAGRAAKVGGVAVRLDDAGEDVDCGEDLERAVDGGATDLRAIWRVAELGHELLGAERAGVPEHGLHDRCARGGEPVAVGAQDSFDLGARGCAGGFGMVMEVGSHASSVPRRWDTVSYRIGG